MAGISGGDKLEAALAAISANLQLQMNVGILAGATNEVTLEPIAPYAAANEYGTLNIPARPFMRNTVAEKSGEWSETLTKLISNHSQDASGINKSFVTLGEVMVQDIRGTIDKIVPPPSAKATVDAKRREGIADPEKTLVHTGLMQKAINFEIITGESE